LRPEEITAVVAHVRALGRVNVTPDARPLRWITADAAPGQRIFESTCAGCHGKDGVGAEGPALNNPVLGESASDTYLVETIGGGRRGTAMAGFREPSPVRPALTPGDIESVAAYLRILQGGKK
jgi:mono/diheme cytochrome c family protein